VVLLDLRLAQEDGAALVPEIAERLPLAATIILSGSNNLERAIELFRVGIDDYLMKPAPPSC
jgi:ActR/RegA family two-component response regulator